MSVCPTCHGDGYVVEIVGQSWADPYGWPEQQDCPTCSEAYYAQVEADIAAIDELRYA